MRKMFYGIPIVKVCINLEPNKTINTCKLPILKLVAKATSVISFNKLLELDNFYTTLNSFSNLPATAVEEADLTKIEKLLDKIERDKKKQEENHNQVEAAKYLDGVNRALELYVLAFEEISQSLELNGLSHYSNVLKKLFKGMRNQNFSIMKFGIHYVRRTNMLIESQQAQQLQLPNLNSPGINDNQHQPPYENSQFARDSSPSSLILEEKVFNHTSSLPRGWNLDSVISAKPVIVPLTTNQNGNASPQSLTTFRNSGMSPTSRTDVINEDSVQYNQQSVSMSPREFRRSFLTGEQDDEAMRKYLQEHEQMQKDINDVLQGKVMVEKLAPRKISIHLKQALKGLEFTHKKVKSIADNAGNDDDDDDEELEDPKFEEMGDRIKEAFGEAKRKAAKKIEGVLKATKEGVRKGSPIRGKAKSKAVKSTFSNMKDAFTTIDDYILENERKEWNDLKEKVSSLEQEKVKNDYATNKVVATYSSCVRENRDLKEKVVILENEIKSLHSKLSVHHGAVESAEGIVKGAASLHIPIVELEASKEEKSPHNIIHHQKEKTPAILYKKKSSIQVPYPEFPRKNSIREAGSPLGASLSKRRSSIGSNIDIERKISLKPESTVILDNKEKSPVKSRGASPTAEASPKTSMVYDNGSIVEENIEKSPSSTKLKTTVSIDQVKQIGKIGGKTLLKDTISSPTVSSKDKTTPGHPPISAVKKTDTRTPKSSTDMRIINKSIVNKVPMQMSQTATERSPMNNKPKGGSTSPKKPNGLVQTFTISVSRGKKEKDTDVKSNKNTSLSPGRSPERTTKEVMSSTNMSQFKVRDHQRVASFDSKVVQSKKLEENPPEKNLSSEEVPLRRNESAVSFNNLKIGPINFSKYKSQPATTREILNKSLKEKEDLWAGGSDPYENVSNMFAKVQRKRRNRSLLGSLVTNSGGFSDRAKHTGEDEEDLYQNSIQSARYTENNAVSKRGFNPFNSDMWGTSPKASKLRDEFDDFTYTPKLSKYDASIFKRRRNKAIDTNRFDITEFSGSMTQRKPLDKHAALEYFNMYKHEILQIEKLKRPFAFRDNEEEFAATSLPFPNRRTKGLGSYTDYLRRPQSPSSPNHEANDTLQLTKYGSVPKLTKMTLEECIMMEIIKEADGPAPTKEEGQFRVMYRAMLAKVKQQPKFANYIRNLIYRGTQAGLIDDHPVVDFEVFQQYVKNFIECHLKCGENCLHVKNFYTKIGYQTFWNNRAPMVVKRTEIGGLGSDPFGQSPKLPNIAKKKEKL